MKATVELPPRETPVLGYCFSRGSFSIVGFDHDRQEWFFWTTPDYIVHIDHWTHLPSEPKRITDDIEFLLCSKCGGAIE